MPRRTVRLRRELHEFIAELCRFTNARKFLQLASVHDVSELGWWPDIYGYLRTSFKSIHVFHFHSHFDGENDTLQLSNTGSGQRRVRAHPYDHGCSYNHHHNRGDDHHESGDDDDVWLYARPSC